MNYIDSSVLTWTFYSFEFFLFFPRTPHQSLEAARPHRIICVSGMFANRFPAPYVDVLKLFADDRWSQAESVGDVQHVIDGAIGKRAVTVRGRTAAANYIALPKSGSAGLGIASPYLYLQLLTSKTAPFTIHLDVRTTAECARIPWARVSACGPTAARRRRRRRRRPRPNHETSLPRRRTSHRACRRHARAV